MRKPFQNFLGDARGSIAVMSAVLMTVVIGIAAFGVDVGNIYLDRRKAQATVDLAALAAVSDLANADKAAAATIARNNEPAGTTYALALGTYTASPSIAPAQRFQPSSSSSANAARVTLTTSTPLFFGRLLTGSDNFQIQTTATATASAFASFAIGSRLASVNGGLLNQVLGGLLGANLSLSAMDYNALLGANIDLFQFSNALAARLSMTGVTYDSLLDANVSLRTISAAMLDAERAAYGFASPAANALAQVNSAAQSLSTKVNVGSLVDLGPYGGLTIGETPKVGASVGALDMVTALAQVANQQQQINVALNVNIPGIAAATLKLAVGERPQGTSWVTVGPKGASVHTAQTRLLLTVQLVGGGAAPVVNLPIYIELASATATLNTLQCGFPDVSTSTATLGVTPAVIDSWIGAVSNSDFTNFSRKLNPPAATLVNAPLATVTGLAHVAVTNLHPQQVTFNYADVTQRTKKTVGTRDYAATLLSSLVGGVRLNVNVAGLGIGLPSPVTGLVAGILSNAVSPLDQLLSSILGALGVGLGQADVWVTGIRCDGAVLVI